MNDNKENKQKNDNKRYCNMKHAYIASISDYLKARGILVVVAIDTKPRKSHVQVHHARSPYIDYLLTAHNWHK